MLLYVSVFPAHAGVFLFALTLYVLCSCIPRSCGGVSYQKTSSTTLATYSPLMRGCFLPILVLQPLYIVFPAHAGVFLTWQGTEWEKYRIPRSCGGVSSSRRTAYPSWSYSPLMRGCFRRSSRSKETTGVFPAHAGVFLYWIHTSSFSARIPRSCGGVSSTPEG